MIAAFNRNQRLLACLNFIAGVLATAAAFVFFLIATRMILSWLDVPHQSEISLGITLVCVVLVFVFGVLEYRRGGGHTEYHESDLYPGFDLSTGSGYWANARVQEVTAPAYFLSQLFLAAPMQVMRGISRLQSRIPESQQLERGLASLLDEVNANPTWHPLRNYTNRAEEIGYLIRMEKIQFSPRKGTVRPL